MPHTVTYHGQTYRLSNDPTFRPLPLPDWWPTGRPVGWEEINTSPFTGHPGRAYCRAYQKHGTVRVIVTAARYGDGKAWVHLSVSRKNREIPSWTLMSQVKETFLGPERTAYQVMPPRSKHVNIHEGCLHLFCCLEGNPLPDFTAGGETI